MLAGELDTLGVTSAHVGAAAAVGGAAGEQDMAPAPGLSTRSQAFGWCQSEAGA